jgi:hypothetical protein
MVKLAWAGRWRSLKLSLRHTGLTTRNGATAPARGIHLGQHGRRLDRSMPAGCDDGTTASRDGAAGSLKIPGHGGQSRRAGNCRAMTACTTVGRRKDIHLLILAALR